MDRPGVGTFLQNKHGMTRKEFLKAVALGVPGLLCAVPAGASTRSPCSGSIRGHVFKGEAPSELWKWSIEAMDYTSDGQRVQCGVCPNRCVLEPGDRSVCRSRVNLGGKLYSLTYGNPCAVHVDPIEKKPLNHFLPGTRVFSIATTGCNLRCLNCQNWEISQRKPEEVRHGELFPEAVVREALQRETLSIAYTYSEAITFYEYMFDTARLAREAGIRNVLVSNGYINKKPLLRLSRFLDGANINLKSFEDCIYRCLNGGTLPPILRTLKTLHEEGVWLEITTLVVPTYVDDADMIRRMCEWILTELGPDHPLHFTRFHPAYRLTRLPPTPVETLERFRRIALDEGIHYVFVGNVPGHEGSHTYCHQCGRLLIERRGYRLGPVRIQDGRCAFCGARVPGRWLEG
ncbi:MAG: AmmeMemoRadiSam system radical SAM enzyme [Desulfobacteraceae bacterium]|jgi:pyruvate formate lyase activating enzyme